MNISRMITQENPKFCIADNYGGRSESFPTRALCEHRCIVRRECMHLCHYKRMHNLRPPPAILS